MRNSLIKLVLIMTLLGTSGCAALMIGSAAGLGAGVVSYVGNELRVSREVTIDKAWEVANQAMKEMEYSIIFPETRKDKTFGVIHGRNARKQLVRVDLIRRTDKVTDIHVRVGVFETPANKAAAHLFYEKMTRQL